MADTKTTISEDDRVSNSESRITNHESRWYVVQTKPTAEAAVQQHLRNADFETFLPKIRTMVRSSGRMVSRVKALFPSYLFAHIDLNDPNLYRMIRYTRGVRKILGDGAVPIPVPDEMIAIIRERVGQDGVIEQQMRLKEGTEVRIRTGPFKDLVGILERPVSAAGRVRVLLKMMKYAVRAEMSAGEVERIDD